MQIGERLKEARLEKGLTLEEIQKKTKIQTRHLQAIEKGDFSLMPGSFYTRAFIKEYALAVGLNPEELFNEFKDEVPPPVEESSIQYVQRSRRNSSTKKNSPFVSLLPTIFVFILILGVAFVIWLTFLPNEDEGQDTGNDVGTEQPAGDQVNLPPDSDESDGDDDETESDQPEENEEDEEPETDEQEEIEPSLTLVEYNNNESNYEFLTNDEEIQLVIETTGRNWLEVEDEAGNSLYYGTLESSASPLEIDVSEFEQVYLRFGEPGIISIYINDIEVELAEEISPSAVQRVWITLLETEE